MKKEGYFISNESYPFNGSDARWKDCKNSNHFPDWTEKADKKYFMERTKASGVMIFGKTTFDTLPGVLPGRLHIILSRSAGEWDGKEENVIYTHLSPQKIIERLEKLGI
ncbi:hypothetical protein HC823_01280 [Candidatus Gracilibacteria bacterium]|nr:hypothetical protein [Candidatus Gracilibacteria bacterium]